MPPCDGLPPIGVALFLYVFPTIVTRVTASISRSNPGRPIPTNVVPIHPSVSFTQALQVNHHKGLFQKELGSQPYTKSWVFQ
ncbi:hypothetical protein SESBI_38334 [Sesbania bispinosa]|nr:hypothetical protein SESBI_38334 [Sesbania bispinosa]